MKKTIGIILPLLILTAVILISGPWTLPGERSPENVKVGAFYYPWYGGEWGGHQNWNKSVMRTKLNPPQLPVLGEYDSRNPEVIGQHIQWSQQGNIKFWVMSWWGPESAEEETISNHILTHPDMQNMEYAILYESQGRLGSFQEPDYNNLIEDVRFLKNHHFKNDNYLKIDGRPVLYFYLSREYFKGDRIKYLAELKAEFPELYIIGDDLFMVCGDAAKSGLLDGVNNYDVYGQSFGGKNKGSSKFELWKISQIYRWAAKKGEKHGFDLIPSVAPGYNDTAVRDGHAPAPRYFQKEGKFTEVFRQMILKAAFPYLDEDADNIFMITSFNEWYEDTQIEPTTGSYEKTKLDNSETEEAFTGGFEYEDYGTEYLDILRELTSPGEKQ